MSDKRKSVHPAPPTKLPSGPPPPPPPAPKCPVDGDTVCFRHDTVVIAILARIVDACYEQSGTMEPWKSIRADIEKLTT